MDIRSRSALLALLAACLLLPACSRLREAAPETPSAPRTVQGFRIQIYTTPEKAAADREVEAALAWWDALPAEQRPSTLQAEDLPVFIKWQQPYYRVRIGDFASRPAAERALSAVRNQFPDAFIVPDLVTID